MKEKEEQIHDFAEIIIRLADYADRKGILPGEAKGFIWWALCRCPELDDEFGHLGRS